MVLPTSVAALRTFPYRRNPAAATHVHACRDEAIALGLIAGRAVERFERFVVLDALVYPYAEPDRLRAAGGFNQWLFFLDDQYDDDPAVGADPERVRAILRSAFDVLSTGRLPWAPTPFDRLTVETRARVRGLCSHAFWNRFLDDVHDYLFQGTIVALRAWRERRVLLPPTYRVVRRHDSGMACVIDLAELALGEELSPAELRRPDVQAVRAATADHVAFLNDLVSYHKEVVRAGSTFNLVHAVATHETGGSVLHAVHRVAAELDACLVRFDGVAAGLTGAPARHAEALRHWIGGNHRFSMHGGRYHHPDAHLVELRGEPLETPPAPPVRRAWRPKSPMSA